jgi:hypothetical protein
MSEENLTASYRLAEFALLAVWSGFHQQLVAKDTDVTLEFVEFIGHWCNVANAYHERLSPYYLTQDALASALPDSLLVADAAFTQLGRLGLQTVYWASVAVTTGHENAMAAAVHYSKMMQALLDTHSCLASPVYDHHAIDVHVAMLALSMMNEHGVARGWLQQLVARLTFAARHHKHWPLSATFENALRVTWEGDLAEEFMSTSTFVPILLTWSGVFKMQNLYQDINQKVRPAVSKTTMTFWSPDVGYDALLAAPQALHEHGVGEGILHLPETAREFLEKMEVPLAGVQPIEGAAWYGLRLPFLPLLASLHWRLQIPREMLVKQAQALAISSLSAVSTLE